MRKFLMNWLFTSVALAGVIAGTFGAAVLICALFGLWGMPIALAAWFALGSFIWACLITR